MITEDGSFRCENCKELIPDTMLWIETLGTYKKDKYTAIKDNGETKTKAVYEIFRWDFCDLHCLKEHLNQIDMSIIHEAKHKVKAGKKK